MWLILFYMLRSGAPPYRREGGSRDLVGIVGVVLGFVLGGVGQLAMVTVVPPYVSRTPWQHWGSALPLMLLVTGSPVLVGSLVLYASLRRMRDAE